LVSHDRRFLDHVVTSTLVAEGDGVWREYVGDVQDWLTQSARTAQAAAAHKPSAEPAKTSAPAPAPAPAAPAARRKLSYKEQRELDALPADIAALEAEQAALEAELADGQLYANDPALAAQKAQRLAEVEERWTSAMERLETLQNA
jgi:ATP-binding cassette subfamily F protein uup